MQSIKFKDLPGVGPKFLGKILKFYHNTLQESFTIGQLVQKPNFQQSITEIFGNEYGKKINSYIECSFKGLASNISNAQTHVGDYFEALGTGTGPLETRQKSISIEMNYAIRTRHWNHVRQILSGVVSTITDRASSNLKAMATDSVSFTVCYRSFGADMEPIKYGGLGQCNFVNIVLTGFSMIKFLKSPLEIEKIRAEKQQEKSETSEINFVELKISETINQKFLTSVVEKCINFLKTNPILVKCKITCVDLRGFSFKFNKLIYEDKSSFKMQSWLKRVGSSNSGREVDISESEAKSDLEEEVEVLSDYETQEKLQNQNDQVGKMNLDDLVLLESEKQNSDDLEIVEDPFALPVLPGNAIVENSQLLNLDSLIKIEKGYEKQTNILNQIQQQLAMTNQLDKQFNLVDTAGEIRKQQKNDAKKRKTSGKSSSKSSSGKKKTSAAKNVPAITDWYGKSKAKTKPVEVLDSESEEIIEL